MTILTKPSFVAKAPEENQNTVENGAILDQVSAILILIILLSIGIFSQFDTIDLKHAWTCILRTIQQKKVNMD